MKYGTAKIVVRLLRGSQWEKPKVEKCRNAGILSILSVWGNEFMYWFVKCINTLKLYYIQECFSLCLWIETCQNRVLIHTGLIVRLVFLCCIKKYIPKNAKVISLWWKKCFLFFLISIVLFYPQNRVHHLIYCCYKRKQKIIKCILSLKFLKCPPVPYYPSKMKG